MSRLVERNIKLLSEDLLGLFLDIALFLIPAGYVKLHVATSILIAMRGETDRLEMKLRIDQLQLHGFLTVTNDELQMHGIFKEYAKLEAETNRYVNVPLLEVPLQDGSLSQREPDTMKWQAAKTINICDLMFEERRHADRDRKLRRLRLEVGSETRALRVRNSPCSSCKCILELSGDLSKVVWWDVENVKQVAIMPTSTIQVVGFDRKEAVWRRHLLTWAVFSALVILVSICPWKGWMGAVADGVQALLGNWASDLLQVLPGRFWQEVFIAFFLLCMLLASLPLSHTSLLFRLQKKFVRRFAFLTRPSSLLYCSLAFCVMPSHDLGLLTFTMAMFLRFFAIAEETALSRVSSHLVEIFVCYFLLAHATWQTWVALPILVCASRTNHIFRLWPSVDDEELRWDRTLVALRFQKVYDIALEAVVHDVEQRFRNAVGHASMARGFPSDDKVAALLLPPDDRLEKLIRDLHMWPLENWTQQWNDADVANSATHFQKVRDFAIVKLQLEQTIVLEISRCHRYPNDDSMVMAEEDRLEKLTSEIRLLGMGNHGFRWLPTNQDAFLWADGSGLLIASIVVIGIAIIGRSYDQGHSGNETDVGKGRVLVILVSSVMLFYLFLLCLPGLIAIMLPSNDPDDRLRRMPWLPRISAFIVSLLTDGIPLPQGRFRGHRSWWDQFVRDLEGLVLVPYVIIYAGAHAVTLLSQQITSNFTVRFRPLAESVLKSTGWARLVLKLTNYSIVEAIFAIMEAENALNIRLVDVAFCTRRCIETMNAAELLGDLDRALTGEDNNPPVQFMAPAASQALPMTDTDVKRQTISRGLYSSIRKLLQGGSSLATTTGQNVNDDEKRKLEAVSSGLNSILRLLHIVYLGELLNRPERQEGAGFVELAESVEEMLSSFCQRRRNATSVTSCISDTGFQMVRLQLLTCMLLYHFNEPRIEVQSVTGRILNKWLDVRRRFIPGVRLSDFVRC